VAHTLATAVRFLVLGVFALPDSRIPLNRRSFIHLAGSACAASAVKPAFGKPAIALNSPKQFPVHLGKVTWVGNDETIDMVISGIHELGLQVCQIGFDNLSVEVVGSLREALRKYQVEVNAISEHNPGPRIFDFYQGPLTIGIIPAATRAMRIQALKLAADVASRVGIPAIHTHCGFIPEDPNDPIYPQAVAAVKEVAGYCKQRNLMLLCETGQETPITLVRLIEDVNLGNVFVNLDVANLILYGKGNPVDAMEVFGDRVRGVHAKDGRFPTDSRNLGTEMAIGAGMVDFQAVFSHLKKANYSGAIMIEREVGSEEERKHDVLRSIKFLEDLIRRTYG
jgi:L-ribulose-5-phosphate 3-epimerase